MGTRLESIARTTADSHGMFAEGSPVLAMVSGGADSVCLLLWLASLPDIRPGLCVLTVNHLLRGAASDDDEAFVVALCGDLGVPCRVVRYDVAAYAEAERLNLEDAGRRIRYRFAEEESDARVEAAGCALGSGRIAVAHTFDDRMETFLMRLATGAGPTGLMGIPYVRGKVVRPLLDIRRSDVVEYLETRGQGWREDATNSDTSRLRARVRAELLPLFEAINPRFDDALARSLAVLGDEDDLLDSMARAFANDFGERRGGGVRLDRSRMVTLSRPMRRRVVRMALQAAFPESSRIEFEHIEALVDGLSEDGFARDLPEGLRALCEYGTLVISRDPASRAPMAPSLLEVPGTVDLGPAGTVSAEIAGTEPLDAGEMTAVVDADRLRGILTVGSVLPGDRMKPLGMGGTRKLQDVLTDAKVPRRVRHLTPVIRDGVSIVWVAGVRMSEDYRVGPGTVRALRLHWTGPADQEDRA